MYFAEFTPNWQKYQGKESGKAIFFQKKSVFTFFQIAESILYAIFFIEEIY